MTKIGFLVGKDDEIYDDKELKKKTLKKHLVNGQLNTDVAIAMLIKLNYTHVTVDIILPKEITLARLKKNDVNFIVGYDYINCINDDPYVQKFAGPKGSKKLYDIYFNPQAKVFPPKNHLDFIWDKKKYLTHLNKRKIPISPTIFVNGKVSVPKLLNQVKSYKWKKYIIKPIGGTTGYGLGIMSMPSKMIPDESIGEFDTKESLKGPMKLVEYFKENNEYYSEYLVQPLITGFRKYGEIKSFWIDGRFSYAVNTIDRGPDDYQVKYVIDKRVIEVCKEIGERVIQTMPKLKFGTKRVLPVSVRIDFTCCLDNDKKSSYKYFVNEIEHQDAGTYKNFDVVKYPMVEVMADAFVKKAEELVK